MTPTDRSGTQLRTPYLRDIVIVDDDGPALILLARILRHAGWRSVRGFRDPRGALRSILRHPCELVITDLQMLGMTGLDLAESLHARLDAQRRPRMILMTGAAITAEAREVFDEVFAKPVRARALVEAVHRLLGTGAIVDGSEVG